MRHARQIGLGDGAVVAYGLQNDALVELAHAHVVGATHAPRITSTCGVRRGAAGSGMGGFVD
jgi:hypothetical protein